MRFFGIGNELEAILTTLTLIGAGAWLETRRGLEPRRAAAWFVGIGVARRGGLRARVASAPTSAPRSCSGSAPRPPRCSRSGSSAGARSLVVVGGGALGARRAVRVDLVLGGAHLSRSVLGAGEAGDVLDVLDRRVTLMVHTFTHPVYPELLAVCAVLLIAGAVRRRDVLGWFGDRWAARSGYLGALAGVLVGTVANDSGSVLLVIGTIYLAVVAGFFWALAKRRTLPAAQWLPSTRAHRHRHALLLGISGGRERARRRPGRRAHRAAATSFACSPPTIRPTASAGRFTVPSPSARELPEYVVPLSRTKAFGANGSVSNIGIFPDGVTKMRRELREFDPDVVHVHEPPAGPLSWDACSYPRRPGGRHLPRLLDQAAAQPRRHARRRAPQVQPARRRGSRSPRPPRGPGGAGSAATTR